MCMDCDWEDYLIKCEEILEEKDSNIITSIYEWIEEHQHVSEKQAKLFDKLKD